jgi:hypothetical protein
MRNLIKILLCFSLLFFYQCEKDCSPVQFDFWLNGVLTKANFALCPGSTITLIKDSKTSNTNFYQFITTNKKSLYLTSQNDDITTRIDTNKTALFLPNQISTCTTTSELKLKVDFFTRSNPNDVRKKNKIESISGQIDKFSLKVNEEIVIDSIAIDVASLSKPCVLQFSDNFNGTNAKFYIKINRCGIIEHDKFQLHWSFMKKLYINSVGFNDNLFKGEIKVLFEEEI